MESERWTITYSHKGNNDYGKNMRIVHFVYDKKDEMIVRDHAQALENHGMFYDVSLTKEVSVEVTT